MELSGLEPLKIYDALKRIHCFYKKASGHFMEPKIFREVIAYKAKRTGSKLSSTVNIVNNLSVLDNGQFSAHPLNTDKMILASRAVDRLRVLGLGDVEIAKVFAMARYNEKENSIPQVDKILTQLMKEKGIDEDDMETVDGLVDTINIKHAINLLKAAKIAQEEFFAFEKKMKEK